MADDVRAKWREALDSRFGDASTSLVCLVVYALALAAAHWATGLVGGPILAVLASMVAATLVVFAFATLLGNASLYDPFWSVAPPLVLIHLILTADREPDARACLVLAVILVWSVRLTWNCMDRWRRLDEEDFRYRDLRAASGRLFPLVNLGGIELFPTMLVFLGCMPLIAVAETQAAIGPIDVAAAALAIGAIALETIADRQLRAHRLRGGGGILTSGVWGWSQHPNYLGEVGFWWALFLFGLAAGAPLWTGIGAVAMTALFTLVSIPMMLRRKRLRRPGYDGAVAGIPVLVPRPWRRPL